MKRTAQEAKVVRAIEREARAVGYAPIDWTGFNVVEDVQGDEVEIMGIATDDAGLRRWFRIAEMALAAAGPGAVHLVERPGLDAGRCRARVWIR